MSDKDTVWVTIRTDDHYPTGEELERVSEALDAVYGDDYETLVTTDDLELIDADDAREIADKLIDALEGAADEDPTWECPKCYTENTLNPAVVDLCVETWDSCDKCGERYKFNLRGKSA